MGTSSIQHPIAVIRIYTETGYSVVGAKTQMRSKSTIFWLGVVLTVAGFVVGTLGDQPPISCVLTPSVHAASRDFAGLENGQTVTERNGGFPLLVQATRSYCSTRNVSEPWEDFHIVRFENRHSVAIVPVFFAIPQKGQALQLRFDWFAIALQSVLTKSRIPWAITIFCLGLLITILDHFLNDKRATTAESTVQ